MTSIDQQALSGALDQTAQQFVLWCLEAFGLRVHQEPGPVYRLEIPRRIDGTCEPPFLEAEPFDNRRFCFGPADASISDADQVSQCITFQSDLIQWIFTQLGTHHWPMNAAVTRQPISVRELTEYLFNQYQFDEGQMHLAGCSFEDRPFLRLTYLQTGQSSDQGQISHCFASADGELLDASMHSALELERVKPLARRSPRLEASVLQQWVKVVQRRCHMQADHEPKSAAAATLIWCKYAVGKISFSTSQASVELPFSGWAKFFSDRRILPPPYSCPLTGVSSYHLAVTDDGQITVAEAIGICAESGRRVLDRDLVTCSTTGRRVMDEFAKPCPVTGEPTLRSAFQSCDMCRQQVSQASIVNGKCAACNELKMITSDDPRWQQVSSRFPRLQQWRGWKISETATAYVLLGTRLCQRILLVIEKDSLDPLLVAKRSRLSSKWIEASDQQRSRWLDT